MVTKELNQTTVGVVIKCLLILIGWHHLKQIGSGTFKDLCFTGLKLFLRFGFW